MTDQPKPLTDEELHEIAAGADWREVTCHACGRRHRVDVSLLNFACANHAPPLSVEYGATTTSPGQQPPQTRTGPTATSRLVAEVRRLRSDAWLERAIEEIAGDPNCCDIQSSSASAMIAIAKKHRDHA